MSTSSARKFYQVALFGIASCGLALAAFAGGDCEQRMTQRLDAEGMSSGHITAAEHAARAGERFDSMDIDKDGKLAASEIGASHGAESAAWAKTRLSAAEKIKQLDSDGDGMLTRAEYADGSQRMFERLDRNRDGILSASEMRLESMTAHDVE